MGDCFVFATLVGGQGWTDHSRTVIRGIHVESIMQESSDLYISALIPISWFFSDKISSQRSESKRVRAMFLCELVLSLPLYADRGLKCHLLFCAKVIIFFIIYVKKRPVKKERERMKSRPPSWQHTNAIFQSSPFHSAADSDIFTQTHIECLFRIHCHFLIS